MKVIRIISIFIMLFTAGLALHHIERFAEISRRNTERIKRLEEQNKPPAPPPFVCRTATEDELRARCVAKGKDDRYAEFMVLAYRSGMTRKEIADRLCIAEGTVKKYKHDRTRELEEPLKGPPFG